MKKGVVTTPRSVWRNPWHFLAFGFGSGAVPKGPGTAGTAVAMVIYVLLPEMGPVSQLALIVVSFAFGVWLCEKTSNDLGVHDHGGIVWDEFVGYWITMFMAPQAWFWPLVGFALFRVLDIFKPWPVNWADREVKGGMGIMLDDVLAGIMAALCIQAIAILVA